MLSRGLFFLFFVVGFYLHHIKGYYGVWLCFDQICTSYSKSKFKVDFQRFLLGFSFATYQWALLDHNLRWKDSINSYMVDILPYQTIRKTPLLGPNNRTMRSSTILCSTIRHIDIE